jgi:hypothetical protein
MEPVRSPLAWLWMLILLFLCGLLAVIVIPTQQEIDRDVFELFKMNGETVSSAANADVVYVRAVQTDGQTWTFDVTVEHPDSGWDDYADGWDVVLPDGTVIKPNPDDPFTRLLLHPHENEQPFTRSQAGIVIPPEVKQVTVRAHDLVDGWGGREVVVDLMVLAGVDFEVKRLP